MVISIHDIPGQHQVTGILAKLADKTVGSAVVAVMPFKCKVRRVTVMSAESWVGVNSTTNYNNLILSQVVGGVKTALGTISGSAAGTVVPANTEIPIYAPAVYPTLDEGDAIILEIGTVGAGTTAAPAMTARVIFEGA